MKFKALRVTETTDGKFERTIIEQTLDDLPPGEVLIRVKYSSLNYKDALSATGNKGITKKFPHTPGIDAAGVVELSRSEHFGTGDEVIVTGHDLGMNTAGGYAQYIRIPAAWIVRKPDAYTLKECMIIGTAGFTAATAVHKMELLGQSPERGPIVVTGSTGGVGSLAVCILASAGYEVIAVSGKENALEYLQHLGAARMEPRSWVNDESGKALLKSQWAGAVDTVGGNTLVTLLKGCMLEGSIVCTGLVGSPKLDATVYPFILNGVSLLGVGSAEMPMQTKLMIWEKLSTRWNLKEKMNVIGKEVSLQELNSVYIESILKGQVMGRIVVNLDI
jgi:acrylyl-CoA reductase (NADPH)